MGKRGDFLVHVYTCSFPAGGHRRAVEEFTGIQQRRRFARLCLSSCPDGVELISLTSVSSHSFIQELQLSQPKSSARKASTAGSIAGPQHITSIIGGAYETYASLARRSKSVALTSEGTARCKVPSARDAFEISPRQMANGDGRLMIRCCRGPSRESTADGEIAGMFGSGSRHHHLAQRPLRDVAG